MKQRWRSALKARFQYASSSCIFPLAPTRTVLHAATHASTLEERVYIRTTKTSRIVRHSCFSFARQPDLTGCCAPFCSFQGVLGKVARCMRKAACNGACNVVHNMRHSGNKTLLCIHYLSSPEAPLWSLTVNPGK